MLEKPVAVIVPLAESGIPIADDHAGLPAKSVALVKQRGPDRPADGSTSAASQLSFQIAAATRHTSERTAFEARKNCPAEDDDGIRRFSRRNKAVSRDRHPDRKSGNSNKAAFYGQSFRISPSQTTTTNVSTVVILCRTIGKRNARGDFEEFVRKAIEPDSDFARTGHVPAMC